MTTTKTKARVRAVNLYTVECDALAARLAEIERSEPAARRPLPADGCGACGDACRSRGSCQLADESPEIEQRGTP